MLERKRRIYGFDTFRLDVSNRELRCEGQAVVLPAKAFDMLVALVEGSGRLIEKDELFRRVWPDQIVEESNLTVQLSAIRKALGERRENPRYIVTVPGHGYRFIGQVVSLDEGEDEEERETAARPRSRLAVAVVLAAIVVTAGGLFALQQWRAATERRTPAFPQPTITTLAAGFNVRGAALSPDGKYVLYLRSDEGIKSIWLGQTNSSSSVQISQPIDAEIIGLTFAPDGHSLYYILSGADYPKQSLFGMSITGGVPRQILTHISSPITFSPDGRSIAFVRHHSAEGRFDLVIASAEDGSAERVVVTRRAPKSFSMSGPAWSSDGLLIALGGQDGDSPHLQMIAVSPATGAVQALTEKRWGEVGRVAWLEDKAGLVFVARDSNSTWLSQIWFLDVPGGTARAITNDVVTYDVNLLSRAVTDSAVLAVQLQNNYHLYVAPQSDPARARKIDMGTTAQQFPFFDPAFTPDGRIVYAAVSGESRALWLMNADGDHRRQITIDGEVARYPSVTSEGRYIVYESTRAGRTDIWRVGVDGSNRRPLTTNGDSYHPHCAPDGTWVAYVSAARIWRVPIDGGEPKRLTDRRSNWPRVSPDGRIAISLLDTEKDERAQVAVIPGEGGEPTQTFKLTRTGTFNDGVRWSSDGQSIIFRDYRFGIWSQPLSGGPPQPLKGFANLKVFDVNWSLDGEQMIYTSGAQARVLTLIRGFR